VVVEVVMGLVKRAWVGVEYNYVQISIARSNSSFSQKEKNPVCRGDCKEISMLQFLFDLKIACGEQNEYN